MNAVQVQTRRTVRVTGSGGDQRARLLDAMLRVVSAHGYGGAKVGDIASQANVSRATFYELFADKQACFTAAHRQFGARVVQEIEEAVTRAEPADAVHAAFEAISSIAQREPGVLAFLTHEALVAGPQARGEYERLTARLERSVQERLAHSGREHGAPGVPVRILLGGATRLYCLQIRREGRPSGESLPALLRWADSYRSSCGEREDRSRDLDARLRTGVGALVSARYACPRVLPRGRHRLPKAVVDEIQRERIAYATAQAMMEHDGASVAVADIVACAGVSREVFYAHFADKQAAFLAASQLIFEQLMAVSSGTFFVADEPWAERVLDAIAACAGLLAANPSFAHFAFVAAYGTGEDGARRVDVTLLAFGLFLQDGYRSGPEAEGLSRLTSDAIVLGVMEVVAHEVRNGATAELPALVPMVAYTAVAPFIGPAAAELLLEAKLAGPG